jgi:hypothetical protein
VTTFAQRTTSPIAAPNASTVIGATRIAFSSGISKNHVVKRTRPATAADASTMRTAPA